MLPMSYALESYTRAHMDQCLAEATRQRTRNVARPTPGGMASPRTAPPVWRAFLAGIPRVRPPRPTEALTVA